MLAILAGLGTWVWSSLQDYNREQGCQSHREQANRLDEKAREIRVPLVSSFDPAVTELQLEAADLEQKVIEGIAELGGTAAPDEVADAYSDRWAAANQAASEVLNHQNCFNQRERDRAKHIRDAPDSVASVTMPEPARCADGWLSPSIGRQGACSHHGGVAPARPWAILNF
ncbi:DUF3761 domain-containing protein [Streptomyces sp. NBC_00872]|uniref:DUF3761 domain-containing protein n=1 Tax=Streptomyces sp. NBC_00872 TaxID=2903686 RepID=UPI0038666B93|nr:DUF3761 domain-containing protein [Streptomyces sp. NBC_00872]